MHTRFRSCCLRNSMQVLKLLSAGAWVFLSLVEVGWSQTSNDEVNQDSSEEVEQIVVTGSRLVRRDLTAASPVYTVGSEALSSGGTGKVTVEQALNELPQLVPDNTSSLNSPGGAGVWTADLRGLGSERTLVLVDGRRFIPASVSGLTDLASIPTALVERVEIVTGGASAVYGSDAIAGAVNFILKDHFEGFQAEYLTGETSRGDGRIEELSVTLGGNFGNNRGNAVINAVYTSREPVLFEDRSFSAIPLIDADGVNLVPSGAPQVPGTEVNFTQSQLDQIVGVDFDSPPTVDFGVQSGLGCTNVAGVRFGEGGQPLPFCTPEDNFNFAAVNFLLRPLERYQLSSLAHFDINESISVFSQLFFTHKENTFQQAPAAVRLRSAGAPSNTLLIPNADTNPLFFQPVRDFFAANSALFDPDADGIFEVVGGLRVFNELPPRIYNYRTNSWNVTVGAEGELGSDWRWQVFGQRQRADQDAHILNQVSSLRLSLGLDVVTDAGSGELRCRNEFIGCVPINLFGINSVTPQMGDFLATTILNTETFKRDTVGGSLSGELFELPAGPVPIAVGFEMRNDEFSVVPDAVSQAGEFSTNPPVINSADVDVNEVFVETSIPIAGDLPLVDRLALETGVRYSDYSSIGGVTTWKLGVNWTITDWVRMRTMYNRAIRAPNMNELFSPPSGSFVGVQDPCDVRNNPTEAERQLCIAQGVPAGDVDTFVTDLPGYTQLSGGNPDLQEEEANTYTLGFVLRPPMLKGLGVAIDYYSIEVDQAIAAVSAQGVVDECFRLLDSASPFCEAIDRLPSGFFSEIDSRQKNIATLKVEGIDLQIDYVMDLPDFLALPDRSATVDLGLVVSEQFENSQQNLPGSPAVDCAGYLGPPCSGQGVRLTPDSRGNLSANWRSGSATIGAQVHWLGDLVLVPGTQRAVEAVDAEYLVDLSASYLFGGHVEVFGGVNNLFDNQPTPVGFFSGGDPNVDPSAYDVLGRRYFVGAKVIF